MFYAALDFINAKIRLFPVFPPRIISLWKPSIFSVFPFCAAAEQAAGFLPSLLFMGCLKKPLGEKSRHLLHTDHEAWNAMLENREDFLEHWKAQLNDQNPLVAFRAKQFMKLTENAKPMEELDVTIVSKTLDHCEIKPLGVIDFYFLDGSHIGLVTHD